MGLALPNLSSSLSLFSSFSSSSPPLCSSLSCCWGVWRRTAMLQTVQGQTDGCCATRLTQPSEGFPAGLCLFWLVVRGQVGFFVKLCRN